MIARIATKRYPVIDCPTLSERMALGVRTFMRSAPDKGLPCIGVHAVPTGEFREPKAGEWYLSGAIIEAYKAPNDLSQKHHIAQLVAG